MYVDNKGIVDGLRRGESASSQEREMPICGSKFGKKCIIWQQRRLVEVEHVKAHRTKEDKKEVSHFEKFVTEGNEKADELAKGGALLDEGFMAEARAETMQQEREEVCAALQYAASFHCLEEQWKDCEELRPKPKEKWILVDKRSEGMKHRTEWCAEADRCRCMRCGRGSKHMKMPGRCDGPNFLVERFETWGRRHLGGHDLVRRIDRQEQS